MPAVRRSPARVPSPDELPEDGSATGVEKVVRTMFRKVEDGDATPAEPEPQLWCLEKQGPDGEFSRLERTFPFEPQATDAMQYGDGRYKAAVLEGGRIPKEPWSFFRVGMPEVSAPLPPASVSPEKQAAEIASLRAAMARDQEAHEAQQKRAQQDWEDAREAAKLKREQDAQQAAAAAQALLIEANAKAKVAEAEAAATLAASARAAKEAEDARIERLINAVKPQGPSPELLAVVEGLKALAEKIGQGGAQPALTPEERERVRLENEEKAEELKEAREERKRRNAIDWETSLRSRQRADMAFQEQHQDMLLTGAAARQELESGNKQSATDKLMDAAAEELPGIAKMWAMRSAGLTPQTVLPAALEMIRAQPEILPSLIAELEKDPKFAATAAKILAGSGGQASVAATAAPEGEVTPIRRTRTT